RAALRPALRLLRAAAAGRLTRIRQRREHAVEAVAQVLELRRQAEVVAELLARLVGGESGAVRGELEQHAARNPEVDRAEVEAVDHRGRLEAGRDDVLTPE